MSTVDDGNDDDDDDAGDDVACNDNELFPTLRDFTFSMQRRCIQYSGIDT